MTELLINEAQIAEWQNELQRIHGRVGELNAEADLLVRKIEAARCLLGLPHTPRPVLLPPPAKTASVSSLIIETLRRGNVPLGLKDLRDRVMAAQGIDWGPGQINYFYTAVARLEKDGIVARDPLTKIVALNDRDRDRETG